MFPSAKEILFVGAGGKFEIRDISYWDEAQERAAKTAVDELYKAL